MLLLLITFSSVSYASVRCENDFSDTYSELNVLRTSENQNFLSENWNNIPHINELSQERCEDTMSMELIKVRGSLFWVFRTTEDDCDGGNIYGVIYNYKLARLVAKISDGDIMCL